MDFVTHLCIANKLKRIIKKELDVKLNTFSFLFGNVKPDLSSKYIKIPHFKKDSNDFVQNEIKNIMNSKVYQGRKCSGDFSERLGIITHYISDFFCYAHSEHFKGNMTEHYFYEIKMLLRNFKNSKQVTNTCNQIRLTANNNIDSIFNYIDILNEKYLSVCCQKSPETDIAHTMNACAFLCLSVISECLVAEESLTNVAFS